MTGAFSPSVPNNASSDYVMFGEIMTHIKITSYKHLIKGDAGAALRSRAALRSGDKLAASIGIAREFLLRLQFSELAIGVTSYHRLY